MDTVAQSSWINNMLSEMNLSLYVSKPAYRHFLHLLQGMMSERRNGSMTTLRDQSFWHRHLTSVTRFFHYGQWDEEGVQRKLQQHTL